MGAPRNLFRGEGFAVVNVGDNGEVANVVLIYHNGHLSRKSTLGALCANAPGGAEPGGNSFAGGDRI